jgi:hypothetical protein
MRTLLKRLMWLSAIFLIVWIAVILYWKSTSRLPSESDLVVYLGLLPLVLAGVVWGGYKLATRPPAPAAPDQASGKVSADKLAADAARQGAEEEKNWTLNIVATSLHTAAGASAADVLAKLKSGPIDSELDTELKNADGFPVPSARIADLEITEIQETFAEWGKSSNRPQLAWADNQYRTLHLANVAINELAPIAGRHPDVQKYLKLKEAGRLPKEEVVQPLRLVLMWPTVWSAEHQATASAWVKTLVAKHDWPEHRIVVQESKAEHINPISLLDHITVSSRRAQLPTIGILLACDSGIDQVYVDALAEKNNLFSGKNTQGAKPGELAAGLFFADAKHTSMLGDVQATSLHRASWAVRDKSADEQGRVSAALLGDIVTLAMETSKAQVAAIQHVVTDNDHKPSREAEFAEMVNTKFPDLDTNKNALKVSQSCGSSNAASAAALCIAHQYVVDEKLSVLCTSLNDPRLRAAVVISVPAEKIPANALGDSKVA